MEEGLVPVPTKLVATIQRWEFGQLLVKPVVSGTMASAHIQSAGTCMCAATVVAVNKYCYDCLEYWLD